MKVIILEDENRAINHLKRLIAAIAPEMHIVASFDTVRDAVAYLRAQPMPDLIFSDVQLADGISFDIFKQVSISCPIIFTTAYDQYAIEAFSTNGIDYLLKPIEEDRLGQAIKKLHHFSPKPELDVLSKLADNLKQPSGPGSYKSVKSRFMIRIGEKIRSIPVEEIMIFYSLQRSSFIFTRDKRNYPVDYSMDELEQLIDPGLFYRVNRRYIVSINSFSQIIAWSNSRLKIEIPGLDEEIIVARERVRDFKSWLDG